MERRLGRGLDSLIARTLEGDETPQSEIALHEIRVNPKQPRQTMNEASLEGLSSSIKIHGVLQPIVVRRVDGGYELVAGERRFRASKMAGKTTIPAAVVDADGALSLEMALIENIQREDLAPLDEAAAYEQLLLQTGMTHRDLATRVGKSRTTITNSLRLLELPEGVKRLLESSRLSAGMARALMGATDEVEMQSLAEDAVRHGWSVRDVERRVSAKKGSAKRRQNPPSTGTGMTNKAYYEEELRLLYGTKVTFVEDRDRGDVRFAFYSAADRDRLVHQLLAAGRARSEVEAKTSENVI